MRINLFSILIPLIIFSSCTISEKKHAYIDDIDRLEKVLDSTANLYYAIDTSELFSAFNLININLSRLSKIDTVVSDSVKVYAALQKSFKRFISEHSLIMDEISYSKNQFQTLKKDIRKGRITDMQIENYFHEESEAVGILMHKISFNSQSIAYQLRSFSVLNDSIEMIIKRLENRSYE